MYLDHVDHVLVLAKHAGSGIYHTAHVTAIHAIPATSTQQHFGNAFLLVA